MGRGYWTRELKMKCMKCMKCLLSLRLGVRQRERFRFLYFSFLFWFLCTSFHSFFSITRTPFTINLLWKFKTIARHWESVFQWTTSCDMYILITTQQLILCLADRIPYPRCPLSPKHRLGSSLSTSVSCGISLLWLVHLHSFISVIIIQEHAELDQVRQQVTMPSFLNFWYTDSEIRFAGHARDCYIGWPWLKHSLLCRSNSRTS